MEEKLCSTCKHVRVYGDGGQFSRCAKSALPTGFEDNMKFCQIIRGHDWLEARVHGTCGREGRFWEPRNG